MDSLMKGLMKDFTKSEMLSIATELEVAVTRRTLFSTILEMVLDDLDENGIPDDGSELLEEFLVAAEYLDEDGNILPALEIEESENGGDDDDDDGESVELPPCFGFADKRDPACRRCEMYDGCLAERIASRPPCFGRLYSGTAEECEICIEASNCVAAKERVGGKNGTQT